MRHPTRCTARSRRFTRRFALPGLRAGIGLLLLAWSCSAYPPAPHHRIYGTVRDEMGDPLVGTNAVIILETAAGAQIKSRVVPGLQVGANYRLEVPLDAGITDDLYKPTALKPLVSFRLKVQIGQTVYLPIEMKGDYSKLGRPGQSTQIDLTLGEDANGNGLPDAWERALIARLGGNLTLNDIRPEADSLGHGLSNLQEYLAGTYATETKDGFALQILRPAGDGAALEFMTVRGRSYSICASQDLRDWQPVSFRLAIAAADTDAAQAYYAQETRVVQVVTVPEAGQPRARYFKLMVR